MGQFTFHIYEGNHIFQRKILTDECGKKWNKIILNEKQINKEQRILYTQYIELLQPDLLTPKYFSPILKRTGGFT